MKFVVLFATIIASIRAQLPSPCPEVLSYEPRTQTDRWFANVVLQNNEPLEGIWLRVTLDQTAELLGNWFGDSSTTDNKEFTIRNTNYRLEPDRPETVRFFVKFNAASIIPSIVKIRLNGKVVCVRGRDDDGTTTKKPFISQYKPSGGGSSSSTTTTTESSWNRPNFSGNGGGSSGGGSVNNNNRPTRRPGTSTGAQNRPSDSEESNGSGFTGTNTNSSGISLGSGAFPTSNDAFPGDFHLVISSGTSSTQRPTARPQLPTRNERVQCGTVANLATPLISHGENTTKGQWPWHTALYTTKNGQLNYICGGTLISDSFVVTAAHCVTRPQSNRQTDINNLVVYLGKYSLKKFGGEVQERDIEKIIVHPNYNYTVFFNDIALLKLEKPLDFTNYIRPCCLWSETESFDNWIDRKGTVVGWGFDENQQISDVLMKTQMPIVSTTQCIFSNRDFFSQFLSDKNFCAGFRNGTSVCNGDSGGGMVFPKTGTSGQNAVWQLRGLVSVSVALQGQAVCDTNQYIIFTDVAKYTSWIKRVMDE